MSPRAPPTHEDDALGGGARSRSRAPASAASIGGSSSCSIFSHRPAILARRSAGMAESVAVKRWLASWRSSRRATKAAIRNCVAA